MLLYGNFAREFFSRPTARMDEMAIAVERSCASLPEAFLKKDGYKLEGSVYAKDTVYARAGADGQILTLDLSFDSSAIDHVLATGYTTACLQSLS